MATEASHLFKAIFFRARALYSFWEMDLMEVQWFVGSPLPNSTRICYDDPSGAHPLTPSIIKERYAEIRNSALVVWRMQSQGVGGVRSGIDEATWRDAEIEEFVTSFSRPAKGAGHILLAAKRKDGAMINILLSDRYDSQVHEWHLAVADLLDHAYRGSTRVRDDGYDA